jgi:hypothetical protein
MTGKKAVKNAVKVSAQQEAIDQMLNIQRLDSPMTKWDFIRAFNKRNKFREIGSGTYSHVYSKAKSPYVYKIGSFEKESKDPYLSYLKAIAGKDNPVFPKIRTITLFHYKGAKKGDSEFFYVVEMEKLKHFSYKNTSLAHQQLREKLDYHVTYEAYESFGASIFSTKTELIEKDVPQIDEILNLLGKLGKKFKPDWHEGNLMMRKDGHLVITDPVH